MRYETKWKPRRTCPLTNLEYAKRMAKGGNDWALSLKIARAEDARHKDFQTRSQSAVDRVWRGWFTRKKSWAAAFDKEMRETRGIRE